MAPDLHRVLRKHWPMESLFKSCQLVCGLPLQASGASPDSRSGQEVSHSSSWNSLPGFTEGSIAAPAELAILTRIVMHGGINTTMYLRNKYNSSLLVFICRAARNTGVTGI